MFREVAELVNWLVAAESSSLTPSLVILPPFLSCWTGLQGVKRVHRVGGRGECLSDSNIYIGLELSWSDAISHAAAVGNPLL